MNRVVDFLFEARTLKELARAGYAFLGSGNESVAEHSFMTAIIAFTMARMETDLNAERLVAMALVHDLAEARTADLNYVNKKYVIAKEDKAIEDLTQGLFFGEDLTDLMEEFSHGRTREARLARDADQLSFILELKKLEDTGAKPAEKWLAVVKERLKTDIGMKLGQAILCSDWDRWWMKDYSE